MFTLPPPADLGNAVGLSLGHLLPVRSFQATDATTGTGQFLTAYLLLPGSLSFPLLLCSVWTFVITSPFNKNT